MANPPNILFLFTDQQRPDWIEMNREIPVRTPHIPALGNRGVRFTNAADKKGRTWFQTVCSSDIDGIELGILGANALPVDAYSHRSVQRSDSVAFLPGYPPA